MTPTTLQAVALGCAVTVSAGVALYVIVTDLMAAPVDHDRRPWHPPVNQFEADARAAVLDRPRATTVGDVVRLSGGPTVRFIARQMRAVVAGVKAYRETAK